MSDSVWATHESLGARSPADRWRGAHPTQVCLIKGKFLRRIIFNITILQRNVSHFSPQTAKRLFHHNLFAFFFSYANPDNYP
jgi:hypothetical protein